MKIRQGFVSNSSSSSFCIYATTIDINELVEIFNKHNYITHIDVEEDNYDPYEALEEIKESDIIKNSSLEMENISVNDDGIVYIGRSYDTIKDDETGKQFKDSTKASLEKILGQEMNCDHCEEAWAAY